ncbi:MAG: hypothetical protein V3576_04015 [Candidatus Cloacimonadota bacterium]
MLCFALVLLLLLALAACEIFGIRDSEYPSAPPLWNNSTSTWEQVVQNLGYCYTDSRNVVKYSSLFTSNYRFYFAAQDIVDFNLPSAWEKADEQDMLLNLHSLSSKITLALEPLPGSPDEILASEARIFRIYQLSLKTASGTSYYNGSMELQLRRESGYWYLYRWYDYRTANESSWGRLKYVYSQ